MIKVHRGDVILAWGPDGKGGLKERPLVVFRDAPKNSDTIVVYCTTQNDGDESNTILVKADSEKGIEMGIDDDTYIRPFNISPIKAKFMIRKIGKCPYMQEIQMLADKKMAQGK